MLPKERTKAGGQLHSQSGAQKSAAHTSTRPIRRIRGASRTVWKRIRKNGDLYVLLAPALVIVLLFDYMPMYGIQIAFKNFSAAKGIWDSPWVGFYHFQRFFESYYFWRLIGNTLELGLYQLIAGFPAPIVLALLLNEVRSAKLARFAQTVMVAPHFLSTVVVAGIVIIVLSPGTGLLNNLIVLIRGVPIYFLTEPAWYKTVYVFSGIWQETGWASIVYLAALTLINPQLIEAAKIDGANRWQRIVHIYLPGIRPAVCLMFILQAGMVAGSGLEKALLLQNSLNLEASDILATHVYRKGIAEGQYSYSAAVGLFNSLINLALLLTAHWAVRKHNEAKWW